MTQLQIALPKFKMTEACRLEEDLDKLGMQMLSFLEWRISREWKPTQNSRAFSFTR